MNRHLLIFLDKYIFQVIFYFLVLVSKISKREKAHYQVSLDSCSSILLIRPGGLGDVLMSIPLLRKLRTTFPESDIKLICVKKNKAALDNLPYYDEIIVMDDFSCLTSNLSTIFKSKFDIVFDLEPFRKVSSIIAYLSGASVRIGFDTNNRRLLYTHYVSYANDKSFESLNMIRQLKIFDIAVPYKEATDISFPLAENILAESRKILECHGVSLDRDFVVAVAPGVLKNHHRWIMSEFARFIELTCGNDNSTRVVLLGTSGDIADVNEVLRYLDSRVKAVNLVGKTSYQEALGVLQHCNILVASDGGIVYMAAAMGCNTISLWGPGVMERFKPVGDNHIGVRKEYACVPCVNYSRLGEFPKCPYDRMCIKEISASDVFAHYLKLKAEISSPLKTVSLK